MMPLSTNFFSNASRYIVAGLAGLVLAACGGGGGSAGITAGTGTTSGTGTTGGTTVTGNGKIQIALVDSAGVEKNIITSTNPLTAKATVTDDAGAPIKDKIVTFALTGGIATLSPTAGTALTDATGVAQISVKAGTSDGGAGSITASVSVGTTPVTATAVFTVGPTPSAVPVAINFVDATPSDKSIVIQGAGGNGRTEVALLTFSVVDQTNTGVGNQTVTFSTQSTQPVTLTSTSGVTGTDGKVSVALNSGTQPTTVRVIASVKDTSITAISDIVTVTTGQPTQAAFSLSQEKFYVEGLNFDDVPDTITALLADEFGGAVADGTPVVFTTDGGAIVGTGGAKCLTVAGKCQVTWRSQKPHPVSGVATVVATSTNGTSNLATSLKIYMSGSFALTYKVAAGSQQGNTVRQTAANAPILVDFGSSCTPVPVLIEITDELGNPMPEGTTISAGTTAINAAITIDPATVSYQGMFLDSTTRGTVHTVTVTPSGCLATGTVAKTGSVNIVVKSPLGSSVITAPIQLTFKGT